MTNNGRILKSNQLESHEIVVLGRTTAPQTGARDAAVDRPHDQVEEALLFTATEVEDLCAKARASGAADASIALEPALQQLISTMSSFAHDHEVALQQASDGSSRAVVDTAISVARWVLGRELSEPSALLELVARALNEPLTSRPCKLRVHPDLISLIYEEAPETVELLPDGTLELGEFRVVSDGPEVAFHFDTLFERAGAALTGSDDVDDVEGGED